MNDNNVWLILAEIVVTIIAPLFALYQGSAWPRRRVTASLVVIPVLWYVTYAPLHELSHVLGAYAAGGNVTRVQWLPRFWLGEVAGARIEPVGLQQGWPVLLMGAAPYVLDVGSAGAGLLVLRRRYFRGAFAAGFAFMILGLRPLFDLVCETVAYLSGRRGDLYFIAESLGAPVTLGLLIAALLLTSYVVVRVPGRLRPTMAPRQDKEIERVEDHALPVVR